MRRLISFVLMVGVIGPVGQALAFESNAPRHRIHEAITREAAESVGLGEDAQDRLADAVNDPDWRETRLVDFRPGHPWLLSPKPGQYHAEHHFDRGPDMSHEAAFRAGSRYIRESQARVVHAAKSESLDLDGIGALLHSLQDFFAHSNVVDLPAEARRQCVRAVWDPSEEVPSRLRITAFFPNARHPETPDDPERYTHGAHSKDAPDKNADALGQISENRSRFEEARAMAVDASIAALRSLQAALPEAIWTRLAAE